MRLPGIAAFLRRLADKFDDPETVAERRVTEAAAVAYERRVAGLSYGDEVELIALERHRGDPPSAESVKIATDIVYARARSKTALHLIGRKGD